MNEVDIPVYVFDLDGVITNPSDSQVDEVTVHHIYDLLQSKTFIAVNTGRSYQWVKHNLLQVLEKMGARQHFDHLFIACEKGGEAVHWVSNAFLPQPSQFALPTEAYTESRRIFDENKNELTTMFWDATKHTMATIEKTPSADFEAFKNEQHQLVERLHYRLKAWGVKIDPTTIATDIESPQAGKHAGAELIYEWIAEHTDVSKVRFISIGDSRSDYEMARHFSLKGAPSTFVFVGAKDESFEEDSNVMLVRTQAHYALGTREYFAHT